MVYYVIRVDSGLNEIIFEGSFDECLNVYDEIHEKGIKERMYIIRDKETYEKRKGGIL